MKTFLRGIVVLIAFFWSASLSLAQGPYNLVIDGQVTRGGGTPAAYRRIILTTNTGEVLEAKADWQGKFRLTGTVKGDRGRLEVKSAVMSGQLSFGTLDVTWAAGGPGDKHLTIKAVTDGEHLSMEGTERPPNDAKKETTPAPVQLPTAAPAPKAAVNTPASGAVAAPPPSEVETGDNTMWVIMLCAAGLIGVALMVGGAVYFIKTRS